MTKAKLFLLMAAVLLWVAAAPLLAADFDFGGTVTNSTAYEKTSQTADPALDELAALALWFDLAGGTDESRSWSLGGQVRYEFADDRYWLLDLDYLKFTARVPVPAGEASLPLEISAGRYRFTDPSGLVLSHAADGLSLGINWPRTAFRFDAGYTGLIINPKSDIRMTSADWGDASNEAEHFFGPSRLFALASVRLAELGGIYTLTLFGLGQFDLNPPEDRYLLHTQYLGAVSDRRYGSHLYETLTLVLQTGEGIDPEGETTFLFGGLLSGHWRYLREDWLGSRIGLRLLATLPEANDDALDLLGFVPLNQGEFSSLVSPRMEGLGLVELSYSFLPFGERSGTLSRIQPGVAVRGYFRTHQNAVLWMSTDPESDSPFLGTEIEGSVRWRIVSDVGFGLTGGVFLPAMGPAGAAAEESDPLWSVGIDLSIGF